MFEKDIDQILEWLDHIQKNGTDGNHLDLIRQKLHQIQEAKTDKLPNTLELKQDSDNVLDVILSKEESKYIEKASKDKLDDQIAKIVEQSCVLLFVFWFIPPVFGFVSFCFVLFCFVYVVVVCCCGI